MLQLSLTSKAVINDDYLLNQTLNRLKSGETVKLLSRTLGAFELRLQIAPNLCKYGVYLIQRQKHRQRKFHTVAMGNLDSIRWYIKDYKIL